LHPTPEPHTLSLHDALPIFIAGNGQAGVFIFRGRDNQIKGNYIGVAVDGVTRIPNGVDETSLGVFGQDGVFMEDASSNLIGGVRSEEHTSELQSRVDLVCRL